MLSENLSKDTQLKIREIIKTWLTETPSVAVGLIYGSLALNQMRLDSDVDVAILCKAKLSVDERIALTQALEGLVHKKVDLVDLNSTAGIIVKEIFTSGEFLKKSDPDLLASRLKKFYLDETDYGRLRNIAFKDRRELVFGKEN